MTTIIYFIMACSFAMGTHVTVNILYLKWMFKEVGFQGLAVWFICWLIFLLCLWQRGYIS